MKKLLLILAICLTASCGLVPEKNTSDARKKEIDDALASVDVPSMEKTLYDSGQAALANGDSLKAEYYFEQLTKKDPKNDLYKFKYAETLRRRGACAQAVDLYAEVLKDKPNDMDATEGKALCLVSLGDFQKAGPILTDIIHKDSTRWKSINAAGLIFAVNKKFKEANQYLDLAAEVSNRSPAVLNNQGLVRALVGNYADAIKILQEASIKAAETTGEKRQIDLNLAMVYGISKNMDKAEETAKPWLTTPQLYNNMGIYAELAKDSDLARTYLNKALMGTPVYYDRAWDNLEKLNGTSNNGTVNSSSPAAKTTSNKTKKPSTSNSTSN
jgi:Flp pilus assembly protein TadD